MLVKRRDYGKNQDGDNIINDQDGLSYHEKVQQVFSDPNIILIVNLLYIKKIQSDQILILSKSMHTYTLSI